MPLPATTKPPFRVCITWDDGLTSDLPLIDWLTTQGLVSSFCLSPGRYQRNRRPNDPRGGYGTLVSQAELRHYQSQDILAHGLTHTELTLLSPTALRNELQHARDQLEDQFARDVPCLSYPYGQHNAAVRAAAKTIYTFARGTWPLGHPPQDLQHTDPLQILPSAHWLTPDLLPWLQTHRPNRLLLWGHTYEFQRVPYGFFRAVSLYQHLRDLGARFTSFLELMHEHTHEN